MAARWRDGMSLALVLFWNDSRRGLPLGQVNDRPTWKINMPLYEHVFLARQDLAQAQVDALAENASKIIQDNGGKVAKTETWGLRSLAYRIAKNRKAHYVMLDLDAPAAAVAELERQSNINEDIIRFLTIRVDEHETGPSAMMRRGDKERSRSDRPDFRREEEVE
jgi:small subunit ribosomal protein S6